MTIHSKKFYISNTTILIENPNRKNVLWQRVRSTCLLERDLATGKRFFTKLRPAQRVSVQGKAAGKGPKSVCAPCKKAESLTAHLNKTNRVQLDTEVPKWLKRLSLLAQLKHGIKARSVWSLLKMDDLWIAAYKKLANSPGALTRGVNTETIDGYSLKILKTLKEKILKQEYYFKAARRVYIPKPQGGRRPLGIPAFRDRVVQEVIRVILQTIFEPKFSQYSHGFRPGRSQQSCMKQIRRDFRGTKWFIEGDISQCFDEINHNKVIKILEMHINDRRLIKLIKIGLKAKVMMPNKTIEDITKGTPQGGVYSPLLANIVLDRLDTFISRLKLKVDRGVKRRRNPAYSKAYYAVQKAKQKGMSNKTLYKLRGKVSRLFYGDPQDPNYARLHYTRYADDFLIGVAGPYELAKQIKDATQRFLAHQLKLRMNEDKTLITRAKGNHIPLLGYLIQYAPEIKMVFQRKYGGKGKTIISHREGNLRILANTKNVISRLANLGFCTKQGVTKPNFRYFHNPQSYTVAQVRHLLVGIDNYFKVANNKRKATSSITNIVRSSIVKMFAAKFKLRTQKQVYKKAGRDLSIAIKPKKGKTAYGATDTKAIKWAESAGAKVKHKMPSLPFTKYKYIKKPDLAPLSKGWHPGKNKTVNDIIHMQNNHAPELGKLAIRAIRGRSLLESSCAKCGETSAVEMHHVRALKGLKGKTVVEKMMMAANRKSIPLCWPCHKEVHGWKSK